MSGSSSSAAGHSSGESQGTSSSLPPEKERLIKEFVLMTRTDSKCATFFLESHEWKLQKAVPDYFSLAGQIVNEKPEMGAMVKNQSWAKFIGSNVVSTFTFMTWNVDGLDERNFQRRTENLINILLAEMPDIVFLQELVPMSMNQVRSRMSRQYECVVQTNNEEYFVATLLKKDSVKMLSKKDENFPGSVMGRGVLSVEVQLEEMKLWLHNTHLESTADFKEERVSQLKNLFSKLASHANTHSTIVAGDLNLRDAEVGLAGGIPKDCVDLWEACEKREVCKYTWDSARNTNCLSKGGGPRGNFKPRLRFDRAYLHCSTSSSQLHPMPKHFCLQGVSKVPNQQCYTSDHWALQIYFTINKD